VNQLTPSGLTSQLPSDLVDPMSDDMMAEISTADLDRSIVWRFDQIAKTHANRPAIITNNDSISFADLNQIINAIANAITANCSESRQPIAILLEQGVLSIAAMFAVLKLGRAFLPLDIAAPAARNRWAMNTCSCQALIVEAGHHQLADQLVPPTRQVLLAGNITTTGEIESAPVIEPNIGADDPACMILTSGSTGDPKIVADSHRNILHEVMRLTTKLRISSVDRQTLLRANCAGAVSDTFTALLNGASVVPFDVMTEGLWSFVPWLERTRPTLWRSTPSMFRALADELPLGNCSNDFRFVFLCGESATSADYEIFRAKFASTCGLVNCFGTSETATVTLYFCDHQSAPESGVLPIGESVQDMTVTLEDDDGNAVLAGESGEIVVRSRYLALGYVGDTSGSRQVFKPDPIEPSVRRYYTGDIGMYRNDGQLVCTGRREGRRGNQRGTIDIAGIEAALQLQPEVNLAAVVVDANDDGKLHPIAFVEATSRESTSNAALKFRLEREMTRVDMPTEVFIMMRLPLLSSGKVNRIALFAQLKHYRKSGT
jgi:acyl-CoA synthetase (AMP-forming)/AMP-acid ligase II